MKNYLNKMKTYAPRVCTAYEPNGFSGVRRNDRHEPNQQMINAAG